MVVERSRSHTLYAKTGSSGRTREAVDWWVGWIEKKGRPLAYFAMSLTPTDKTRFADRFEIARPILREAGVLPSEYPPA